MTRLLGCAVIGAGRIGALHARTLLSLPHVRLVAVIDADQEAAVSAAEDRLAATRVDAAFRNPEVDAVVIATPTVLHAEHIEAAARAGKAIFCEKPLTLDLATAKASVQAVEETQVPFQIGFHRRHDAGHVAAQAQVTSLGGLEVISLQSSEPLSDSQHAGPVGIFGGIAIDDIDLARFHGGDIASVSAVGTSFSGGDANDPTTADAAVITLRYVSGALGIIRISRGATRLSAHRADLQCREGRLVVEHDHATPLRVYDAQGIHQDSADAFTRYQQAYIDEIAAFVEAVREGRSPMPGPHDALEAVRLALAAARSLHEGRVVRPAEIEMPHTPPPAAGGKKRAR